MSGIRELLFKLGGRKFILLLIALVLTALKDVLDLDNEIIAKIVLLALGGSAAIAGEDAASKLLGKTQKK